MLTSFFEHFNYGVVIVLMMIGLFVVFASNNLIKKLVGLSVFQTSVFLLYITIGKVSGGTPPILPESDGHGDEHGAPQAAHGAEHGADHVADHAVGALHGAHDAAPDMGHVMGQDMGHEAVGHAAEVLYSNPLPHVLILTAIVVGVATLSVGLALVVRIREVYGTIEEEEIDRINYAFNLEGVEPDEAAP